MADIYDLVVIGAGPAGQSAAELAAQFGRRVVLIEHDRPGGVVATTGGAPTKALREAAMYLTGYRQEEVYGIRVAVPLETAMAAIATRIPKVRDRLQEIAAREIAGLGIAYVRGTARLGPNGTVVVATDDDGTRQFEGRTILVATGSRPTHLPGIDFDDPDVYDTDQIYSIRTVPDDVVVVGGGPIAVEFATVFTALGIPVTLVSNTDRLLPTVDGEMADLIADEFKRRDVKLILGTGVDAIRRVSGRLTLTLSTGVDVTTGAALVATGRTPCTDGLGLADVGVQLDAHGRIVVDGHYRTTAPGIYAAGDVIGPALASTAMQQGRAAAHHACGMVFGIDVDQVPSTAVYSLPEVAGVGLTEEQVQTAGTDYVVGRCDLAATTRGAIAGHGGLLKLIVRADDRKLLGVHCIGDIASEVVGLGHVVLHVGGPVEMFLTLGLNTPTYGSAYHDAARDGIRQLAALVRRRATAVRNEPMPATGTPLRRDSTRSTGDLADAIVQ